MTDCGNFRAQKSREETSFAATRNTAKLILAAEPERTTFEFNINGRFKMHKNRVVQVIGITTVGSSKIS